MPTVKVMTDDKGHQVERTFHVPYDRKGKRLVKQIERQLRSHAEASMPKPVPVKRRGVRSKR